MFDLRKFFVFPTVQKVLIENKIYQTRNMHCFNLTKIPQRNGLHFNINN